MNSAATDKTSGDEDIARRRMTLAVFAAALDQPAADQLAWLHANHGADPALVADVEALLGADRDATRVIPSAPAQPVAPAAPPDRIGPYRIVAPLGSGGMGDVYLGERDDGLFDHRIAVKLMRASPFAQGADAFFDTERRALARLRHPHIARLFDGGVTENGIPYVFMELVEGEPIDVHVSRRSLSASAIAALVADLCDATQHAHRNLVVHADIKPSNVLVEADGGVKLLDFGIAQLVEDAARSGAEPGYFPRTPAFASPQRLAGAPPRPADDIFALGALLRLLVTGRGDAGDLNAVAEKATAPRPEDRYASPAEMRDDLRRWREQRPVSARPPTWRYVTGRFVVRNRLAVAAAGVALMLGIGALIALTALYARAEAHRAEAERRFADVRGLARYMIGDFYDGLETLPGASRLRARTVQIGGEYLERLSRSRRNTPELERELAFGYGRVGHAQAIRSTNATGDLAQGERALQRAETIYRRLIDADPTDANLQVGLARVLTWLAGVRSSSHDDRPAARKMLAEAFLRLDDVLKRHPGNTEAAYARWNAVAGFTDLLADEGRWKDIIALLDANTRRTAALTVEHGYGGQRALLEAASENAVGDARYYSGGGASAALPHYRRAIALLDRADARHPPDVRRQIRRVIYHYQLGTTLQELGRDDDALATFDRGQELGRNLLAIEDGPAASRAVSAVALAHAKLLSQRGRHEEAVRMATAVTDARRALIDRDPADFDLSVSYLASLRPLAEILVAGRRQREACDIAQRARAGWAALARRSPLPQMIRTGDLPTLEAMLRAC